MTNNSRLWRWLGLIFVLSFGALGYLGWQIYLAAPPIPKAVLTSDGTVLFTGDQIQKGQQAWMSVGGQRAGTVWGHGAYVAPDWSADWLHREASELESLRAKQRAGALVPTAEQMAVVDANLKVEMRLNTYNGTDGTITVSPERGAAIKAVEKHFDDLFGSDPSLAKLREQYAMTDGMLPAAEDRKALAAFFF